jgi:ABC-type nitrate/sulfonate/bicarbonate transport system substrate-binding protein
MEEAGLPLVSRRGFLGLLISAAASPWLVRYALGAVRPEPFQAVVGGAQRDFLGAAVFWLPEKLGFFAEEGIQARIVNFRGGGDSLRAVTSSSVHWAIASPAAVAQAFLKGEKLKIISGIFSTAGIHWVVKRESPIRTVRDLRGKRVGYGRPGGNGNVFALKLLEHAAQEGVRPEEVNLVSIGEGAELWTAFTNGLVDVIFTSEPFTSRELEKGTIRIIASADDDVKDWVMACVITSDDFSKKQPEVLRAALRAYQKGNNWMLADLERAAKTLSEIMDFTPSAILAGFRRTPRRAFSIRVSLRGLEEVEKSLLELKLVERKVPWAEIIDQSFLPASLRVDLK